MELFVLTSIIFVFFVQCNHRYHLLNQSQESFFLIVKEVIKIAKRLMPKFIMFPWPNEATEDEHERFLSDFLSKKDGADFTVIDSSGWSPIRRAIYLAKAEIVKLLIDNSMVKNLDTPSCSEFTPLTYAVAKNDLEIVETLIASGAKVDQKDDRGQLPLEIAVERGYIEIVKFLKETKNSNLEIPCVSKYTPLKYAKATNDTKIDHLSLEKAISESNSESIKLLIEKSKGIILNAMFQFVLPTHH